MTTSPPAYLVVAEQLRVEVATLPPLTRVPSEEEIAIARRVSPFTARRALNVLGHERIIERSPAGSWRTPPVDARAPGRTGRGAVESVARLLAGAAEAYTALSEVLDVHGEGLPDGAREGVTAALRALSTGYPPAVEDPSQPPTRP